jgi:hypothetical protein
MTKCPELLEEFTNNFLPPYLKVLLADEKPCRNPKTARVGKVTTHLINYHGAYCLDECLMYELIFSYNIPVC